MLWRLLVWAVSSTKTIVQESGHDLKAISMPTHQKDQPGSCSGHPARYLNQLVHLLEAQQRNASGVPQAWQRHFVAVRLDRLGLVNDRIEDLIEVT